MPETWLWKSWNQVTRKLPFWLVFLLSGLKSHQNTLAWDNMGFMQCSEKYLHYKLLASRAVTTHSLSVEKSIKHSGLYLKKSCEEMARTHTIILHGIRVALTVSSLKKSKYVPNNETNQKTYSYTVWVNLNCLDILLKPFYWGHSIWCFVTWMWNC